jgi:hypothetical protein
MDLPDKTAPAAPKKQVKRIVPQGAAKTAKRSAGQRFFGFVFAESPKALGRRVFEGTIVPRLKAAGEEAVNSFLHGMLWGGGSAPTSHLLQNAVLRPGGGVNYAAISNGVAMPPNSLPNVQNTQGPYSDVVVPTEEFAQRVLAYMYDLYNQYRVVTVGDLYEAAGISSDTQHEGLGWYSLEGSRITKERDGYRIALPRPTTIKN